MTENSSHRFPADEWDEQNFPRPTVQNFDRVVERAISRRGLLGAALAFGSGAAVMDTGLLKGSLALAQAGSRFPFEQIAAQTDGTVHFADYGQAAIERPEPQLLKVPLSASRRSRMRRHARSTVDTLEAVETEPPAIMPGGSEERPSSTATFPTRQPFKLSTDPLFVDKVQDIAALYMSPSPCHWKAPRSICPGRRPRAVKVQLDFAG